MEAVGEIIFAFLEVLIIPIAYILKVTWSSLLWLFSFGYISFMTSWKSEKMSLYGLWFLILLIICIILYFTFRGSYYFN
jgi:hypothetical protein